MRLRSRPNSKLDKSIVHVAWFRETNPTVHSVLTNSQNCKMTLFGVRQPNRTLAKTPANFFDDIHVTKSFIITS